MTDRNPPDDPQDPAHGAAFDAGPPLASCPDLPVATLVAWIDGELAADDAAHTAAHVARCERCSREADLLRRTGDLVAQLPRDAASAGFVDRVLRVVGDDMGKDETVPAPSASASAAPQSQHGRVVPLRRWSAARRAFAAAAVLAAAAGTWWIAASPSDPGRLSAGEEEEIARDLYVIAHLDTLSEAEEDELAAIADDLDAIENAVDTEGDER